MSLKRYGRLPSLLSLLSFFLFFFLLFLICPLTVPSLNLINLSESAMGKCGTEFGVIAECAGRRGRGVVGGTKTLAWGQADVLGCL